MLVQANSSWRWLVSTRPWIIQIRSWGVITERSFYDFTQHSATGRHKLWKQCWKGHWLCTPPIRHVHLRSPRHSAFNSWPSCALYDHSCSFPRTPPDISHNGRCVQGIQKNSEVREWSADLLSFYNTQQWDRPRNNWWNNHVSGLFICFFPTVSPQPEKGFCPFGNIRRQSN